MSEPEFQVTPIECRVSVGPHRCLLFNCPQDDPDWVHICYADDFDWTDGEHHRFRLGRMTGGELIRRATDRAGRRGRTNLTAMRERSYLATGALLPIKPIVLDQMPVIELRERGW
jgi:hypothetical protein